MRLAKLFAADLVDNKDSPAFTAGFSDDGKLGYGFTSADNLEEDGKLGYGFTSAIW